MQGRVKSIQPREPSDRSVVMVTARKHKFRLPLIISLNLIFKLGNYGLGCGFRNHLEKGEYIFNYPFFYIHCR